MKITKEEKTQYTVSLYVGSISYKTRKEAEFRYKEEKESDPCVTLAKTTVTTYTETKEIK
jgi:hypothetical protein